jgi:hypothetical protein
LSPRLAGFALLAAAALACAALVPGGFFLSDDLAQLAIFGRHARDGELAAHLFSKWTASMDGVNGFWRPLTHATFLANFALGGTDPRGWIAFNLLLHLANAVLVAALVRSLAARGDPAAADAAWPAALAGGCLLFLFAPGWEAVLWIACRYDTLATAFTLLTALAFVHGRTRLALLAAALALASKEAGVVALVLVGWLAIARALSGALPREAAPRILRELAPFIVLGLVYLALRVALFGHPTRAYVGLRVDLLDLGHWLLVARSFPAWAAVQFPGAGAAGFALATLAVLAAGLVMARGGERAAQLAVLATLATTLALVLPHVPQFGADGIGGRLFYLPGALLAIAVALALQAISRPGRAPRVATVAALLVIAMHATWAWAAVRDYREAHAQMRRVAAAVAALAAAAPATPAVAFIPDALGRVPFGRNAQGGLMLPPLQPEPLSRRVLVQTDAEIPALRDKIAGGLFTALAQRELFELMDAPVRGMAPVAPSAAWCWDRERFVPMPAPAHDAAAFAAAYARAGCGRERK